jgi:hypothetical protein
MHPNSRERAGDERRARFGAPPSGVGISPAQPATTDASVGEASDHLAVLAQAAGQSHQQARPWHQCPSSTFATATASPLVLPQVPPGSTSPTPATMKLIGRLRRADRALLVGAHLQPAHLQRRMGQPFQQSRHVRLARRRASVRRRRSAPARPGRPQPATRTACESSGAPLIPSPRRQRLLREASFVHRVWRDFSIKPRQGRPDRGR